MSYFIKYPCTGPKQHIQTKYIIGFLVYSKRLKRNTPKQWLFNLTGDVIDIDMDDIGIDMSGDENVLDDNEQQYDRNEVAAGDIHESSTVFETQQNFSNDTEWFRQQLDDEDAPGYFYDPVWTASKIYSEFFKRKKSNKANLHVL